MSGVGSAVSALVGRIQERRVLDAAMESPEAELIAVYGRRRVGKTFLIRRPFADELCFELIGMYGGGFKAQLQHFVEALRKATGTSVRSEPQPGSWFEAFGML